MVLTSFSWQYSNLYCKEPLSEWHFHVRQNSQSNMKTEARDDDYIMQLPVPKDFNNQYFKENGQPEEREILFSSFIHMWNKG